MKTSSSLPMARLTCGHYQRIRVEEARAHVLIECDTCHQCERPHTVILREWFVWCDTCGWDRWMGQLEADARRAKELHLRGGKYAHVVRYRYATLPGMEYASFIGTERSDTGSDAEQHTVRNDDERPDLFD